MEAMAKLTCVETGRALAARVRVCATAWERARGLIGRTIEKDECLWIEPCNMIHTWFMAYPIDAVFVDASNRVLHVEPGLAPWRFSRRVRGAKAVLESQVGWIAQKEIRPGQQLRWGEPKREEQAA